MPLPVVNSIFRAISPAVKTSEPWPGQKAEGLLLQRPLPPHLQRQVGWQGTFAAGDLTMHGDWGHGFAVN